MDRQQIEIRRSEPSDYAALRAIHAQPRAIWGTLQLPFPSATVWKQRLTEQAEQVFGLVAVVGEEIVGSLALSICDSSPRRRHAGTLGMAVHDDWQGCGVGSALLAAAIDLAEQWLALTRLELTVYTDNTPAIQLYEKFGFCVEGTLRRYAFRDGKLVDAYCMARLRSSSTAGQS